MKPKRIVIIGGGISGVTNAYLLGESGHEVTLYEQNQYLGGLAATIQSNDYYYDFGPHEFCTNNPELVTLLKEILGEDFLILSKNASQFLGNKFIAYPLKVFQILRVFSPVFLFRIGLETMLARLKNVIWSHGDYSFQQWVENRYGKTLYNMYFGPYTKKVFGVNPDSLDPRKASARITFNSLFDLLIKSFGYFLLKKEDYSSIHSPLKNKFYYSRKGIQSITNKLAEKSKEFGVKCILGEELVSIDYKLSQAKFASGHIHENFDILISTIPLPNLLSAIGIEEPIMPIKYRSAVFVNLKVPRRPVTPFTWVYFPESEIISQRMTEFSNIVPDMAPEGSSSLGLEISCFDSDEIWNMDDKDLVARVRQDLDKSGILPLNIECDYVVARQKYAYPIQTAGYLEIVDMLLGPIKKISNIVTTGRQGLFKYCNMNECMEMAIELKNEINRGSKKFSYNLNSSWKGAGLEEERISDNL